MPCYTPITGYASRALTKNGKRQIVFSPQKGFVDLPMTIPCGQCIGCRLEKARQWAIRCVHESKLWENNSFVTLTYNDLNLPIDGSISKREVQLFMKRLRKEYGEGIRFYACGEYGEENKRPHYHLILFNIQFNDRELHSVRNGVKLYRSRKLEEIWTKGYSTIGDVTFESASYVARYVTKKITGDKAENHYNGKIPEFALMSRRPGLGKGFVEEYYKDIYVKDEIIMRNGLKMKPPKYYDKIYDDITGNLQKIKDKRRRKVEKILNTTKELGYERRMVKMECVKARITKLKRGFENGDL